MSMENTIVHGGIDPTRVRGLLFDVDGTLSNTDDQMVDRVTQLLSPLAWLFNDRNPRSFARWFVMGVETPVNVLYGLADRLGVDALFSNFYTSISKRGRTTRSKHDRFLIIEGVKEMLESLSDRYPMAVVSARDSVSTEQFLAHFELTSYFQVIVTAQTCEHTKPYPDPVLYAAQEIGVLPEACVMIGDTIVDIHAGKSAGAQTVAVLCGFGTQRELKRAGADLILNTTADVTDILLG